jgi:hypothetical protein
MVGIVTRRMMSREDDRAGDGEGDSADDGDLVAVVMMTIDIMIARSLSRTSLT